MHHGQRRIAEIADPLQGAEEEALVDGIEGYLLSLFPLEGGEEVLVGRDAEVEKGLQVAEVLFAVNDSGEPEVDGRFLLPPGDQLPDHGGVPLVGHEHRHDGGDVLVLLELVASDGDCE